MGDGQWARIDPLEVVVVLRGGPAESGEVGLEDYRVALAGWQSVIELSARLFFLGEGAEPSRRGTTPFLLNVRAPERGSLTTEIILKLQDPAWWAAALATNLASNTLYDILKTQTPRFVRWLAALCRSHIETKRRNPRLDVLAENLRRMLDAADLPANQIDLLPPESVTVADDPLFDEDEAAQVDGSVSEATPTDRQTTWLRQVIESVDVSLEEATQPLNGGCTSVALVERKDGASSELIHLSSEDRSVLLSPISLSDEDSEWERAHIRFRRIDCDSGSVTFRFEDRRGVAGTQFGYIADKSYKRPHNPYTRAFDSATSLSVWVRPEPTERGGTRYAISTRRPPRQLLLVNQ